MNSSFLPEVDLTELKKLQEKKDIVGIFQMLVMPLHEELYKRQDFSFLDELSPGQELMLRYDYVRMQVMQGGFIQFIQNGYISLLPAMPALLEQIAAAEMAKIIDDVLKVYTLNYKELSKETTVEEFAKLYDEFREFEQLDADFERLNYSTEEKIVTYALKYLDEFAAM